MEEAGNDIMVIGEAREITYAFLKLPHHAQMQILLHLKLVGEVDRGLGGMELFKEAFGRARERGIVGVLKEQIEDCG